MGRKQKQFTAPTLSDVARLAGVSVATASRALSNPDLVASGTRDAVSKAAAECGYRVTLVARSLRKRQSDTILVLIPDINNEFYPEIISAMEECARTAGFSMILGMTSNIYELEHTYFDLLGAQRADGLVILDGGIDRLLKAGYTSPVPTVQVLECAADPSMPSIRTDECEVAEQVIAHLAGLGHHRIAHIAGRDDSRVAAERTDGYRDALARRGLPVAGHHITPGNYTFEDGAAAMLQLLDLPEPPTAVFCANDASALGALMACAKRGVRVPEDMSIVGVDDIPYASTCQPPLTTIRQPRLEIGRRAMTLMIDLIRNQLKGPPQVIIPTELIVRHSTSQAQAHRQAS